MTQRCEFNWGSHGCGLPDGHADHHRCAGENGCGDEVGQDGRDVSGFKWALWGPDCRVYWGAAGCMLVRGHRERDGTEHVAESGSTPYPGLMFGEDTTEEERSEM